MFQARTNHICTVDDVTSKSFLPILPPFASNFQKLKRFLKQLILITEMNPQSAVFFRKSSRIVDERKKQVASGSWVIHPFSTFRLYYEMWMTVVFFLCLVWMPVEATFMYIVHDGKKLFNILEYGLFVLSYIDIFFTFQTGACVSKEEIAMTRGAIARHYIFGIHFITDVVSPLPEFYGYIASQVVCDLINYCAMFKILRLYTFLEYLTRTLNYFKVEGFPALIIKIAVVSFLICHYSASVLYFARIVNHSVVHGKTATESSYDLMEEYRIILKTDTYTNSFLSLCYMSHFYLAASLLLGVDISFKKDQPWVYYGCSVVILTAGKVLVTFLTVMLVDIFKITNFLEIKYYSMMSQVDSFMTAHQFPIALQDKIRSFYGYRYRQKYLNEPRIERFISDKLKGEVKYQECRKVIQSVRLFEKFPQEILEEIVTLLKRELYLAKDVVIKAGTLGDAMYFLASGTVAVVTPSGKEVCHLVDGDYFGEICLLVPKAKRTATVIALEVCEVYKMERRFFKKCLASNPEVLKEIQTEAKRRHIETKEIESMFLTVSKKNEEQ